MGVCVGFMHTAGGGVERHSHAAFVRLHGMRTDVRRSSSFQEKTKKDGSRLQIFLSYHGSPVFMEMGKGGFRASSEEVVHASVGEIHQTVVGRNVEGVTEGRGLVFRERRGVVDLSEKFDVIAYVASHARAGRSIHSDLFSVLKEVCVCEALNRELSLIHI